MIDVALATDGSALDLSSDDRLLRAALGERGLATAVLPWTRESTDWSNVRLCIARGEPAHPAPELARDQDDWLGRVDEVSQLANSVAAVRWNLHARYLLDLARAGVRTVACEVHPARRPVDLAQACERHGARRVSIGPARRHAGRTAHFTSGSAPAARRALAEHLAAGDVLLTFDPSPGERSRLRSLVYLDGGFSHALVQDPADPSSLDATLPREDEILLARAALAAVPGGACLFARVDLARDAHDRPQLVGLDLADGPLHFAWGEDSAQRLAGAIFARLARGED